MYFSDTEKLINKISRHFYERCSVGHLDISYPSNEKLFAPILDSPTDLALIAKGANANMLQSDNGTEFGPFRLKTEPDMWGSLWNKKQVHNELQVIFEYIYYRVWRKGSESLDIR